MSPPRLIIVCVLALTISGCGNATEERQVKRAVADFTHAYAAHDAKALCRRIVVSTDLPRNLAVRMHLPASDTGSLKNWDRDYRDCVRSFGKRGEFDTNLVSDWQVHDLEFGPRNEKAGISRSARVEVRTKDRRAKVWFVKFRGDWKFVFPGG